VNTSGAFTQKPLVIFVHGPTGSGKSAVALEAAKRFGGEIINCDSIQVYEHLEIGSAKPTLEEMTAVKHHLIGHVPAGQRYTAGEYRRDALQIIEGARPDSVFYVVGGSGFYSQALLKGMFPAPPGDVKLRLKLEEEKSSKGLDYLWNQLHELDPIYANKVGPGDPYRIMRGLEILQTSDFSSMSELHASFENEIPPFRYVQIGMNHLRNRLKTKLEARTESMIDRGFIQEVEGLLTSGLNDWSPLNSVGYKEVCDFLSGRIKRSELPKLITQSTLQLAKRQMTWFRRDPRIVWFDSEFDRRAPIIFLHEVTRSVRLDTQRLPPDTKGL
jgi:tRNA dimethylallyltransferase